MADRESVIKDLLDIRKDYEIQRCKVSMQVIDDAIALLKESEPVPPKTDDAWPSVIKVCGACGTCLFNIGGYKAKYCSECGKKVKWDA